MRYVCLHGHFYQPPRENPWLEAIELQDSAYPYHDWNERITAECYAPNADSRMLDARERITRIVNNYSRISFNFGPTLLSWMEAHAPDVYGRILEADRLSQAHFSGHGSAIAQAFHHSILPLCNERDRRTEVLWGIRDFQRRFGRDPEGVWLPETAADTPTLETLAEQGIRFTILAPHQARAVRALTADATWHDVSGGRIDPSEPYLVRLPSGREIAVFFYDGPVSRAVAFEGLLRDGERFARRLIGLLDETNGQPTLAHIATDGETYGHHHRHGDMALAYALHYIEEHELATLTNYGEFLDMRPPVREVRIIEETSWSCAHGIERWRSDCGCHTGGQPGWHQRWREPLRDALDWLRDELAPRFERDAGALLEDPWEARDAYIDVIVDRSDDSVDAFLASHARAPLTQDSASRVLKLLELQRHALLMYTSCGWFFNDISGIETVQVLQYAGRAVQLAEELFREPFAPEFVRRLERAESNLPARENGRAIYEQQVQPSRVDLMHVAAHYAVSSAFGSFEQEEDVYSYNVALEEHATRESGESRLSVGRARVSSIVTRESAPMTFAVLHFGSHNLSGGIRRFIGDEEYQTLARELIDAFEHADLTTLIRLLANFPEYTFSLKSLFADRQREILTHTLDASLRRAENVYRGLYEDNSGIIRFLIDLDLPLPRAFTVAAEFVLNRDLRRAFSSDPLDLGRAHSLLEEARAARITLDRGGLGFALQQTLERLATTITREPADIEALERLAEVASLARSLPFEVDLWKVQNTFYTIVHQIMPPIRRRAESGDAVAAEWVRLAGVIGDELAVAVP
jgi:alpha-amylase/alpha-mannosidase (GH57 family)